MATLTVTATHDYRADILTNIDSIVFATPAGATATFGSNQFGPGLISNNVAITGDAHQNVMEVAMSAPGAFSAAGWTFSNWGSSDQAFAPDLVRLQGSTEAGSDTITGSSQNDEIWASAQEFGNDEGADSLNGGGGDDVLRLHRGSAYVLLDGGSGTDTVTVNGIMSDPGNANLSGTTITGVERLHLAGSASAILRGDQIGAGKIQQVEGTPSSGTGVFLTVNGSAVDLSGVTFVNWSPADKHHITINGTSASANTLIGSSQNDTINAAGALGDLLDGRGGNDRLNGGAGDDTYVYKTGYAADTIAGFVAGAGTPDKVDLTGVINVHTLDQVLARATQSGGNTVLDFSNGNTLTLFDVQKTALSADDFVFGPARAKGDLDGDHKSDIVLQNDNGSTYLWEMNGLNVKADAAGPVVGPEWHVRDHKGDLDGDGKSDMVLQNDNGATYFWEMDGFGVKASGDGPAVAPSWHVKFTGDLDGDGKSDIVLQNDNGQTYFWLMDGLGVKAAAAGPVVNAQWHVAGTGDFDGDGRDDVVLQHDNGQTYFWLMNGLDVKAAAAGPAVAASWHIVGTGDLDADGRDDVVLQNDNGQTFFWEMNGLAVKAFGGGPGVAPQWHIRDIGDLDGDLKSDIVLQHDNGQTFFWEMDGLSVKAFGSGPTVDPLWHIV